MLVISVTKTLLAEEDGVYGNISQENLLQIAQGGESPFSTDDPRGVGGRTCDKHP